jgi:hypothetical protein
LGLGSVMISTKKIRPLKGCIIHENEEVVVFIDPDFLLKGMSLVSSASNEVLGKVRERTLANIIGR